MSEPPGPLACGLQGADRQCPPRLAVSPPNRGRAATIRPSRNNRICPQERRRPRARFRRVGFSLCESPFHPCLPIHSWQGAPCSRGQSMHSRLLKRLRANKFHHFSLSLSLLARYDPCQTGGDLCQRNAECRNCSWPFVSHNEWVRCAKIPDRAYTRPRHTSGPSLARIGTGMFHVEHSSAKRNCERACVSAPSAANH